MHGVKGSIIFNGLIPFLSSYDEQLENTKFIADILGSYTNAVMIKIIYRLDWCKLRKQKCHPMHNGSMLSVNIHRTGLDGSNPKIPSELNSVSSHECVSGSGSLNIVIVGLTSE